MVQFLFYFIFYGKVPHYNIVMWHITHQLFIPSTVCVCVMENKTGVAHIWALEQSKSTAALRQHLNSVILLATTGYPWSIQIYLCLPAVFWIFKT